MDLKHLVKKLNTQCQNAKEWSITDFENTNLEIDDYHCGYRGLCSPCKSLKIIIVT